MAQFKGILQQMLLFHIMLLVRLKTNCELEAKMGQPYLLNKPRSLDNVLLLAGLKHPRQYGPTVKILKDSLSLHQSIRVQTARCMRAWLQASPSHGSCRRHLRLDSSGN